MTNNPTHGTFEEFVDSVKPDLKPICGVLRDSIRSLHPGVVETVWTQQKLASYGVGPKNMSEHYAYISPHKHPVNLGFYWGTSLPDPAGLLGGTGKHLRHVRIMTVIEAESRRITDLLIDSIAERKGCVG
jgi:hypothetical protein